MMQGAEVSEFFLVLYALAIAAFAGARLVIPSRRNYLYLLTLVSLGAGIATLPLGNLVANIRGFLAI